MKNNVKKSDWYIGKYGTQSEVTATSSGTASLVPGFSLNKSEVDGTQSTDSSFFKNKLEAKGITFSTPSVLPTFTKKVYEPGTASKGFTQSFAEVVKMKLEEAATPVVAPTASNPLPFQQKFINKGLNNGTASTPFASKARKFFAAVPTNVTKLDATDFQSFVAEVGKFTRNTATSVIKLKKVTVNDLIVTDLNYTLKSEDVVRVGLIGHFVNNPEGIAIVK
jgi:hypothetical protein